MCSLCEFFETHDLQEDANEFPQSIQQHPMFSIDYELALFAHASHGAKGKVKSARHILRYNVPMNYCPECGRKMIT